MRAILPLRARISPGGDGGAAAHPPGHSVPRRIHPGINARAATAPPERGLWGKPDLSGAVCSPGIYARAGTVARIADVPPLPPGPARRYHHLLWPATALVSRWFR